MGLVRRGTYDAGIWAGVLRDYPSIPEAFAPDDVVIDVGCHTGSFAEVACSRGARAVFGYEANRENFALAVINLAGHRSAHLANVAIWRSDVAPTRLRFTPHPLDENTGGGSVLFDDERASSRHHDLSPEVWEPLSSAGPHDRLSAHEVETLPLDDALRPHRRVRMVKIDAEGAEFPILLTSAELGRVEAVCGEYHQFSDEQMANLPPQSVVGGARYDWPLLAGFLEDRGFVVHATETVGGRGLFAAERPARR
ncbi:MAG: FkbM family methyltransferase [Acidimicrobiia bacterium]|nr:FkbM family methyltransferase [Acidimicrobiia bacterium]